MSDRTLLRVFCDRAVAAHVLATVKVGDNGFRVVLRERVETPNGLRTAQTVYTRADVGDAAVHTAGVFCACGHAFQLDLAALLRGQVTVPMRIKPEDVGVSYRR